MSFTRTINFLTVHAFPKIRKTVTKDFFNVLSINSRLFAVVDRLTSGGGARVLKQFRDILIRDVLTLEGYKLCRQI